MAEDKGFTVIPNAIFDLDLTSNEYKVLVALYSFNNKEKGYAYPSYKQLKQRGKISDDRTLIKAINGLVDKNNITKTVEQGIGTRYFITDVNDTVKIQVQENYSTSKNTGGRTVKIQEHPQENYSTTNTNTNTNTNTIYSSSEEEVSSEGSIKANTTQEPIKKEIDRKYLEIFEYWNSLKIIKHKECNEEIIKAIDKALKKYDIETIKLAINNYNTLFKDKRHFYTHRWALKNFLTQGNGISEFLEDGQRYISYQDDLAKYEKEKNKPSLEEERKIEETDFS